ncbi:MAG: thioredoxin [Oscillospiraceae bacterium]
MAIFNLTSADFAAATSAGRVVVDFWATWCGPCRMQGPIMEQLAEAHPEEVKVCKVDVDSQPALAEQFGIMSIPTVIYFQDGKLTGKSVGVQSLAQLEAGLGL